MSQTASADLVRQQLTSILTSWDMPADMVETTVQVMVETDLMGVDSHGISMIMTYEANWRNGRLKVQAKPKVVRESPATALIDAGDNLGHPVSVFGMQRAVEKARKTGVAVVSVVNSHHFGAAGYYARLAAEQGMLGMVTSSTQGIRVLPTGASTPVLGTNPLAFAAPAKRNKPFVLDMATSTVAAGKVKVYSFRDTPMPAGWVMDGEGNSVTDADYAFNTLFPANEGGLTATGGTRDLGSHKGYGLGLMVHMLGGVLAGASFSPIRARTQTPADPDNIGHFFMAIDPKMFREDGDFESDADDVIDILHGTPPSNPDEPVLVAGDPENATREERLANGIPIPAPLAEKVRAVAERCGVAYVLGV